MKDKTSMVSDVLSERRHKPMLGRLGLWLRRDNSGIY